MVVTPLETLKLLFKKPSTNLFPVKYKPENLTAVMKLVAEGKVQLNSPVEIPKNFRGKITYEMDKCIGCQMCTKVCPSHAIEFVPELKKIRIYVSRCTFCSNCNDICPVQCLHMSEEFMLADYDKYGPSLIVGVEHPRNK